MTSAGEKKIPFEMPVIPSYIKAILLVSATIMIGFIFFLLTADFLPSPLKETGIQMRKNFFKNTGGELTSNWETDGDTCAYVLVQSNISAATMKGKCTLEIFEGSSIHANLIFEYKSYSYITSQANIRQEVQQIKTEDRSLRYQLKDVRLDKDKLIFKSYTKQGTIHEFTFILGEKSVITEKVNVIPGLESTYVRFEPESMVFKEKRQKWFGIF